MDSELLPSQNTMTEELYNSELPWEQSTRTARIKNKPTNFETNQSQWSIMF